MPRHSGFLAVSMLAFTALPTAAVAGGCTPSLASNGVSNICIGDGALSANVGQANTAVGQNALNSNTSGAANTAIGREALEGNVKGRGNTAVGANALFKVADGSNNTVMGVAAGFSFPGDQNTVVGFFAGYNKSSAMSGNSNTALGAYAGSQWTTGSNNLALGSPGVAGDQNTIRIGTPGVQARTFVAGIRGTRVTKGVTVLVDANGQLGVARSSARFKQDIQPMGDASSPLLKLRPVTFRYKEAEADGTRPIQYGLIAEEVAQVMPDLAVYDAEGRVDTVAYQLLPNLLLNEYQKQNRELVETKAKLAALEEEVAAIKQSLGRSGSAAALQPAAAEALALK